MISIDYQKASAKSQRLQGTVSVQAASVSDCLVSLLLAGAVANIDYIITHVMLSRP